ncbi:hypothetical protein Tco_1490101 [Tanacetum coccineum]
MVEIGRKGGSIAGMGGGSLAKHSMESNDGLGGGGFVVMGGRADGVKGSGVVFRVSRIVFGMILGDIKGESGGEAFRLDGGAD